MDVRVGVVRRSVIFTILASLMASCGLSTADGQGAADELRVSSSRDLKDSPQGRGLVFETLLAPGEDGEPVPQLAESWEVSEDETRYVFNLRSDVAFHDGTSFTAETAKFSVEFFAERIGYADHVEEVLAPDPTTLVIELRRPFALMLSLLSSELSITMISPTSVEPTNDVTGEIAEYIGTGPLSLEEYRKDRDAVLVSNDDYWDGQPELQRLHWEVIPDPNAQVLALKADEVDVIGLTEHHSALPYADMSELMDDPNYQVAYRSYGRYQTLEVNLNRPATADPRVRHAINVGIDRQAMVESLFEGLTEPAEYLSPPVGDWEWGPHSDVEPWTYDSERAADLLDQAGWVLAEGEEVRVNDGEPLRPVLVVPFGEANADVVSIYIQSELRKIGIDLQVETLEASAASDRHADGDFDLYMSHSCGLATFGCIGPDGITSGYGRLSIYQDSPGVVELIDQALTAPDDAGRRAGMDEVWETLHERALGVPLYDVNKPVAMKAGVENLDFGPTMFTMDLLDANVRR